MNISTIFKTVIEINEQDHKIELKFEIYLEWYEVRAKYHNLKTISAQNKLDEAEVDQLWIPYIIFEVSDNKCTYHCLLTFVSEHRH